MSQPRLIGLIKVMGLIDTGCLCVCVGWGVCVGGGGRFLLTVACVPSAMTTASRGATAWCGSRDILVVFKGFRPHQKPMIDRPTRTHTRKPRPARTITTVSPRLAQAHRSRITTTSTPATGAAAAASGPAPPYRSRSRRAWYW